MNKKILEQLRNNDSKLKTLDLRFNQIGDVEAKDIADALSTNSTLTKIALSGNQIGDAGAIAISDARRTKSTLTRTYFQYHLIDIKNEVNHG